MPGVRKSAQKQAEESPVMRLAIVRTQAHETVGFFSLRYLERYISFSDCFLLSWLLACFLFFVSRCVVVVIQTSYQSPGFPFACGRASAHPHIGLGYILPIPPPSSSSSIFIPSPFPCIQTKIQITYHQHHIDHPVSRPQDPERWV